MQSLGVVSRLPPINEVVGLLERYDPAAIEELRATYPNERHVLEGGITLGGEKISDEDRSLQIRLKACLKGLASGISVCEQNIPNARRKLKRSNTLRFASEIITVIAGASIFTVLAANFESVVRYAVAGLALAGSLLALAATYVGGTLHPPAGNLFDHYKELIDCQVEAKRIQQELEIWKQSGIKRGPNENVITQGNAVCARIMKVASLMA